MVTSLPTRLKVPDYISTFENLDYASEHVEQLLLKRSEVIRSLWLQLGSFQQLRDRVGGYVLT